MMADQQFFLKWNDFQTNMVTSFRHLRDEKSFTDVSTKLVKELFPAVLVNICDMVNAILNYEFHRYYNQIDPQTENINRKHKCRLLCSCGD